MLQNATLSQETEHYKRSDFLSLNYGGLTDAIYLKTRDLVREKWRLCFFCCGMFGIGCYLQHVLRTAMKQRYSGSQAHNGTGLSAVSLQLVLHWKHPLCFTGRWSNMCLACKRSMSAGVITTTEDTGRGWEVMHFLHWSASIHLSHRVWIGF